MSAIPEALQTILDDLDMVGDSGRSMYLIDFSDRFEAVPSDVAERPFPEENHVKECESDAYVFAVPRDDGTLTYHFAVENPQGVSARAFCKILKDSIDGQPNALIQAIPDALVTDLFGRGVSMGKNLGLRGILNMVKYFAREHDKSNQTDG